MKNKKNNPTDHTDLHRLALKIKSAIICVIFGLTSANAQTPINLPSAIDTALKNNLQVKNEKLNSEYQQKLKVAAIDIPQTNLISEYGQINSFYNDTRLGISQSISFPTVYAKQKSLQNENHKSSVLNIAAREVELKKQVSEVFYLLIYLKQKQKTLLQTDSMYASFLEKANLRFAKGETNILERTTAETQRGQITIQLNQLKNDIDILQLQFQLLLNTSIVLIPSAANPKMVFTALLDTSVINKHPTLLVLQQQKKISLMKTQVEKSKLLPNLNIGYYNMSMKGTGADNLFYNTSTRFNSVQFGLGVPLFFGSQKAKINSSKTLELINENNYQIGLQTLNAEYQTAFKQYQTQLQTVKYFEETALQNANTITKTANQQFANGGINYLEWTMLINNAVSIQSNYTDAIKDLNQSIIQLNYLTSK